MLDSKSRSNVYKDLMLAIDDNNSLDICLVNDMRQCQEDDVTDFIMFKKDSFQPVISASLTWETFEQFALWQLLSGHDLPVDCLLPLLPKLSYDSHAEALTHIMILLKRLHNFNYTILVTQF